MAKPKTSNLTTAERRIMEVLWRQGPITVRQVVDALKVEREFAYTTVLTVMKVLTEKGFLKPHMVDRAHVFTPLVSQAQARRSALLELVTGYFGGSQEALALHLVSEELDADERARLDALISGAALQNASTKTNKKAKRRIS